MKARIDNEHQQSYVGNHNEKDLCPKDVVHHLNHVAERLVGFVDETTLPLVNLRVFDPPGHVQEDVVQHLEPISQRNRKFNYFEQTDVGQVKVGEVHHAFANCLHVRHTYALNLRDVYNNQYVQREEFREQHHVFSWKLDLVIYLQIAVDSFHRLHEFLQKFSFRFHRGNQRDYVRRCQARHHEEENEFREVEMFQLAALGVNIPQE